jgi:small subunit ribosomal protein S6
MSIGRKMKANTYESAVIINAALEDEQIETVITRIKEAIEHNGGEIRDIENWGRKRLAYMVKKSKIGYYVFFRFNAPSNIVSKLERNYILDEHILRFLTIKLDSDAIEHIEKHLKAAQDENPVADVEASKKTEVYTNASD